MKLSNLLSQIGQTDLNFTIETGLLSYFNLHVKKYEYPKITIFISEDLKLLMILYYQYLQIDEQPSITFNKFFDLI